MEKTKDLIGVCVFDEPSIAGAGWASIAGEDATRVNGFHELPNDVYWITNVGYRSYRSLNLNKAPHIFDEQYFRTSVKSISQEFGLEGDGQSLSKFCSLVFQATYKKLSKAYGSKGLLSNYRLYSGLTTKVLPLSLRRVPVHPKAIAVQAAINESTQANQAMFGDRPPLGSKALPFLIPRDTHFSWIFSQDLPSGEDWKEIKSDSVRCIIGTQHGKTIKGTLPAIESLIKRFKGRAAFLRCTVKSTDDFYRSFATFSAGANIQRGYATLPEILNMCRYSRVEILGGYTCALITDKSFIDRLRDQTVSYSTGLAWENLYAALGNALNGSSSSGSTALGAYLRSYDRIACQRYAEKLELNGFKVGSFGTAKIMVYCTEGEHELLGDLCLEEGIIPPRSIMENDEVDEW